MKTFLKNLLQDKYKKIFIASLLIVFSLAAGIWAYYSYFGLSPALEMQLRTQFGDDFFDDFEEVPETENEVTELEEIVDKYEPLFIRLEDSAMERLEELFTAAVEDYEQQKAERTLDRFQFTNKYIQAGKMLEENIDSRFYDLLNLMEEELEKNNHPTDIITEINQTYKEAKDEKKEELFERLRNKLER